MKIKRALISVSNKQGVVEFARKLHEAGVEIVSTGGTMKAIKEAGIPVTYVSDVTGFPEIMDGRVKTLNPYIHGGILAVRDNPEHVREMEEHHITGIDLVAVNLYPFKETIAKPNVTLAEAIENIDIGGPAWSALQPRTSSSSRSSRTRPATMPLPSRSRRTAASTTARAWSLHRRPLPIRPLTTR